MSCDRSPETRPVASRYEARTDHARLKFANRKRVTITLSSVGRSSPAFVVPVVRPDSCALDCSRCLHCNTTFTSLRHLRSHIRAEPRATGGTTAIPLRCEACARTFHGLAAYLRHGKPQPRRNSELSSPLLHSSRAATSISPAATSPSVKMSAVSLARRQATPLQQASSLWRPSVVTTPTPSARLAAGLQAKRPRTEGPASSSTTPVARGLLGELSPATLQTPTTAHSTMGAERRVFPDAPKPPAGSRSSTGSLSNQEILHSIDSASLLIYLQNELEARDRIIKELRDQVTTLTYQCDIAHRARLVSDVQAVQSSQETTAVRANDAALRRQLDAALRAAREANTQLNDHHYQRANWEYKYKLLERRCHDLSHAPPIRHPDVLRLRDALVDCRAAILLAQSYGVVAREGRQGWQDTAHTVNGQVRQYRAALDSIYRTAGPLPHSLENIDATLSPPVLSEAAQRCARVAVQAVRLCEWGQTHPIIGDAGITDFEFPDTVTTLCTDTLARIDSALQPFAAPISVDQLITPPTHVAPVAASSLPPLDLSSSAAATSTPPPVLSSRPRSTTNSPSDLAPPETPAVPSVARDE